MNPIIDRDEKGRVTHDNKKGKTMSDNKETRMTRDECELKIFKIVKELDSVILQSLS